jgi:hypothetical protein
MDLSQKYEKQAYFRDKILTLDTKPVTPSILM